MKIGIVDCGIGNTFSVKNAIQRLGHEPLLLKTPKNLKKADKLILPGVGTYKQAMQRLRQQEFKDEILEYAQNKYVLGICLGMQILSDIGYEEGETNGLGLIRGQVTKMPEVDGFQLPHIGWNEIVQTQSSSLFNLIKSKSDFYFVHSYRFATSDDYILAKAFHGSEFAAIVRNENSNVFGIQFHPEKSQKNGLNILKNFISK